MSTFEPSGRNPAPITRGNRRACRAAFALLACLLAGATEAAPRLLVTVDVESVDGSTLLAQINGKCRDGSACGVMEIARMLEERSMRGTFFLNVYESRIWGEAPLRELTAQLLARGHEVPLHTHPHWAYDPKRPYMYEYSAEDQARIVREGAAQLEAWTGAPIIAHRAGAYSANPATLDALSASGIAIDSSWFRDYPHSKLESLGFPDNAPGSARGVLEIPVTIYERVERPRGLGFLPGVRTTRKLDANWFRDADEAARAVDAAIDANPPYVVYFLHSFSLLVPDGTETPAPDAHAQANFRVMLDRAVARGLVSDTFAGLHAAGAQAVATSVAVPDVDLAVPLPNYAAHLVKFRPWTAAALSAAGLILASLVWLAWRAWRRSRTVHAPAR